MLKIIAGLAVLVFTLALLSNGLVGALFVIPFAVFFVGLLSTQRADQPAQKPLVAEPRFYAGLALAVLIMELIGWAVFEYLTSAPPESLVGRMPFLFGNHYVNVLWAGVVAVLGMAGIYLLLIATVGQAGSVSYAYYRGYKENKGMAARSFMDGLLGRSRGVWQVMEGKHEVVEGQISSVTLFGGPATLVVQEGHAVILEKAGVVSRVVGSGLTHLKSMERVACVVELTGQAASLDVENVITKDGVILPRVQGKIFFRVMKGDQKRSDYHSNGRFPYNDETILKLWEPGGGSGWKGATKSIAASCLRDMVAGRMLDVVLADALKFRTDVKGNKQVNLADRGELVQRINCITNQLGVEVTTADLECVEVSDEVKARAMAKWNTSWEAKIAVEEADVARRHNEAVLAKSVADADALQTQENARARAQAQMIVQIGTALRGAGVAAPRGQDIVLLRFIEALEKMATEKSGSLYPTDILALIRALRHELGGDDEQAIPLGPDHGG